MVEETPERIGMTKAAGVVEHQLRSPSCIERPRRSFYERHERLILGGIAVLVALAAWQALWSAGKISPLFFTGPSSGGRRASSRSGRRAG